MKQQVEIFDMYAGSGKTTLLVSKIAELAEQGVPIQSIGFCSYTRTARAVIQKKIVELFDCTYDELDEGWFRTMDGAALEALKRSGDFKGLEIFTPQKTKHRDWLTEIFEGASGVRFALRQGDIGEMLDRRYRPLLSAWNYSRLVNEPFSITYRRSMTNSALMDSDFSEDEACRIIEKLESAKRIEGIVDFTDVKLMYAGFQASLEGNHTVKPKGVVPRVQQFFLDEWQDSSPLTNLVGKRLASSEECEKVTIAGDLNQSVFSFIGCDKNPFDIWEPAKVHRIKRSFRVPSTIGKWAEFALNSKKVIHTGDYLETTKEVQWRDNMDGTYPDIKCFTQFVYGGSNIYFEFARSHYIYFDSKDGFGPEGDWLVLCRTNRGVDLAMNAMTKAGIPCYKIGANPERSKWHRAFLTWHRLYKLGEGATGSDVANLIRCLNENYRWNVYAETTMEDSLPFPIISKKKKLEFAELHKRHKTKDVYFASDLLDLGVSEFLFKFFDAQALDTIVHSMNLFPSELNRYYDLPEEMIRYGPDLFGYPKTRVGTIHKAKGLEADKVGIIANISKTMHMENKRDPAKWNEECNLSYVAMTRARRGVLCIRKRNSPSGNRYNMPGILGSN
jgi:superfamily I DNA/RNA helicase